MQVIQQVMSTEVWTIDSAATLLEAEQFLLATGASELYALDRSERVVGVLPDYELLKTRIMEPLGHVLVRERMFPVSYSLRPTSTLMEAAALLRLNIHRRLPVMDQGKLCGMVSRTDVLAILAQEQAEAVTPPAPQFLRQAAPIASPAGIER